jgi:mycothiol synthase
VTSPDEARIEVVNRPTADQIAAVRRLVATAADVDGTHPLSEHVYLHLTHGGDVSDENLLLWLGDQLAGYAHLDTSDLVAGASAEVVVGPDFRRRGLGARLVDELVRHSPDGRLRLWAHGGHPAAGALARRLGFERARVLWQMRRSLLAPIPEPKLPDGVTVRTFVVDQDEERWLAVNNRAFADHPDQGSWTLDDLKMRESEAWFDPAGFFLAERDGEIVAFHWTKVHGATSEAGHEHEPIGEVYVVGVDPSAQRLGLGPALTVVGLRHLRALGLAQVMLYVDEGNTNAIRVYERLGFTRWDSDVSFSRTSP